MITQITDKSQKSKIVKEILTQLPDWFGMPEGIEEYSKSSRDMMFWSYEIDNQCVGFIALGQTSPHTLEISVMGVRLEYHGKGIGRKLFETSKAYAMQNGYSFIQVKTVEEGTYEEYDRTIAFYKALGFKEFECIKSIWDEANPCQIFINSISNN